MDANASHTSPTTAAAAHPVAVDLRASDAEREKIALLIQQAAAEGRLTPAETDERLAAAFAARRRSELAPLVADLPQPAPTQPVDTAAPRGRSLPSGPLAVHAAIVFVLAVVLIARWALSPVLFFWPAWPIMWLLISLAVHARIRRRRSFRPM